MQLMGDGSAVLDSMSSGTSTLHRSQCRKQHADQTASVLIISESMQYEGQIGIFCARLKAPLLAYR